MSSIVSDESAAGELAAYVQSCLDEYLGFKLCELSPHAQVSASSAHDSLAGGISNALSAWNDLVVSDANALIDAAQRFSICDKELARFLGAGGGAL